MMLLTLAAHAKVNLCLAVGPAEPPSGLHPICSWFSAIDLHDTLRLEVLPKGSASEHRLGWASDAPRPTPIDWPIESDLAVRACRLLEAHAGHPLPVRLTLDKRIPVGGGLGGGSSDAAAALVGLNRLFALGIAPGTLREMSASLGSDVAFFIDNEAEGGDSLTPPRPAIVSGFGESIERVVPVDGGTGLVLVFPPFGCPTGAVYRAFDARPEVCSDPRLVDEVVTRAIDDAAIAAEELFNDLFEPACDVQPALRPLAEALNAIAAPLGTRVLLSGSGSTLFCPLPRGADAAGLARTLGDAAPGCVVVGAEMV